MKRSKQREVLPPLSQPTLTDAEIAALTYFVGRQSHEDVPVHETTVAASWSRKPQTSYKIVKVHDLVEKLLKAYTSQRVLVVTQARALNQYQTSVVTPMRRFLGELAYPTQVPVETSVPERTQTFLRELDHGPSLEGRHD